MIVHLVDGTYELFRQFYGNKDGRRGPDGVEIGAVRGVVLSMVTLLEGGATHVGVATDHVIESFRNDLWPGYKSSAGIDPVLLAQFPLLEEALGALGVVVWPMIELEADDAMASAAAIAARDTRVERVILSTPDKDLGQCVGGKVVQLDRRNDRLLDATAVRDKFGVEPASIADYLALVGDSADGFPGLPGWGAKSAATVLAEYGHVEHIPDDAGDWAVTVRGADKLAAALRAGREVVALFKVLATLRLDAPVGVVDDWEWHGPRGGFADWCTRLGSPRLADRAAAVAAEREGSA
jgi:5'-3' exonuclease